MRTVHRASRRFVALAAVIVGTAVTVSACARALVGATPSSPPAASASASAAPASAGPEPAVVSCADVPNTQTLPIDGDIARPAVRGILDLFDEAPVVAIGEIHGWPALHDVIGQLVCDPRFPDVVDAVVVEFGNSRLQTVLDRFVLAGEAVSRAELQSVWRESTQRSGVWEHPVYERFFALLRSINLELPADRRVRVLAGDPPIDYASVTHFGDCRSEDPSCLDHWLHGRDESFAGVVVDEVLARDQTAVLIAGLGHMLPRGGPPLPPSIPELIEAATDATVRVVIPHSRLGNPAVEPERTIRSWPVPSLVSLDGTWLGELEACLLDGPDQAPSAPPCPNGAGPTLADLGDAYLYVGP